MGGKCVIELIRNTSVGTNGIDELEKKKKEATSHFFNKQWILLLSYTCH